MPAEYLDVKLKPIVAGINPSCRVVSCRGPRILTTCNALLVTPEPSSSITFFYLHGDDEVDPNNGRGTRFNWNEAGYIQRRYKQGNGMAAIELPGMEWDAARGGAAAVERRRRRRLRRRRNPRRQARGVSGRGGEDVSGDACHPPAATARGGGRRWSRRRRRPGSFLGWAQLSTRSSTRLGGRRRSDAGGGGGVGDPDGQ